MIQLLTRIKSSLLIYGLGFQKNPPKRFSVKFDGSFLSKNEEKNNPKSLYLSALFYVSFFGLLFSDLRNYLIISLID